jgi:hypothetical protein
MIPISGHYPITFVCKSIMSDLDFYSHVVFVQIILFESKNFSKQNGRNHSLVHVWSIVLEFAMIKLKSKILAPVSCSTGPFVSSNILNHHQLQQTRNLHFLQIIRSFDVLLSNHKCTLMIIIYQNVKGTKFTHILLIFYKIHTHIAQSRGF